jgi:uncharacterized protein with PhoU and TrkA domain
MATPLGFAIFDDLSDAARFIAALVREGVTFDMCADGSRWRVTLTGGY